MLPINQVILGGDSMFNSNLDDIDMLILKMEAYRKKLKLYLDALNSGTLSLVWNEIDNEILPMTTELRERLLKDSEYLEIYNLLLSIVLVELLNLVKAKIENTPKGKELLDKLLKIVKKLKSKIISDTNKEMEMFNLFKLYSQLHPNTTYDEFLRKNI